MGDNAQVILILVCHAIKYNYLKDSFVCSLFPAQFSSISVIVIFVHLVGDEWKFYSHRDSQERLSHTVLLQLGTSALSWLGNISAEYNINSFSSLLFLQMVLFTNM